MQIPFEIQKSLKADVVIAGGGVAGIAAAVSAARSGADTLLIEAGPYLGGTATAGLVGPFMSCLDPDGHIPLIRGFFEEFCERMIADGGAIPWRDCPGGDSRSGYRTAGHIGVTPFEPECFKRTADRLCREAGVRLLCHTLLVGAEVKDRKIAAVYTADGEAFTRIEGHTFIDCTGSAVLAHKAGASVFRGDENGFVQTASLFFRIDNVDEAALDAYMSEHTDARSRNFMDEIEAGRQDGSFPCGTSKLRIFKNPDDSWTVNMAQHDEDFDELDAAEVTMAEILQREQIVKIVAFLRKAVPPLKNIRLVSTASCLGIRESRRMMGRTLFCAGDLLGGRMFDDRIAVCANSIDVHQKVGNTYRAYTGSRYSIPMGALISRDLDNLLAAGKCLSADSLAFSAVRVMPPCFAMGEAAGICAALAAIRKKTVPAIPVTEIQNEILKRGGYLG